MSTLYHQMWFRDNGNYTHAINYPLTENSTVVDLGAFKGAWASQIIEKYNPYVFLFEPIPEFYEELVNRFASNPKVKVINAGVAATEHIEKLYLNEDGTSKYINQHLSPIEVKLISIEKVLDIVEGKVDLVQINIEGEEYNLLEKMIESNIVKNFLHIQIQFHTFIEDAESRRKSIQEKLSINFNKLFDYEFVFEGWAIKN